VCRFCKKIIFLYYYQRAVYKASREEYLDAAHILNAALFKETFFHYFLLSAFLYERLHKFEESLVFYDKAKYLIIENANLSDNDKNYLYKYINNGYIYIYQKLNKLDKANEIKKKNSSISFNINSVHRSIKNDFVIG